MRNNILNETLATLIELNCDIGCILDEVTGQGVIFDETLKELEETNDRLTALLTELSETKEEKTMTESEAKENFTLTEDMQKELMCQQSDILTYKKSEELLNDIIDNTEKDSTARKIDLMLWIVRQSFLMGFGTCLTAVSKANEITIKDFFDVEEKEAVSDCG